MLFIIADDFVDSIETFFGPFDVLHEVPANIEQNASNAVFLVTFPGARQEMPDFVEAQ